MDGRSKGNRISGLISRFENLNTTKKESSEGNLRNSVAKEDVLERPIVNLTTKRSFKRIMNHRNTKNEVLLKPLEEDKLENARRESSEGNLRNSVVKDEVLQRPIVNLTTKRSFKRRVNIRSSKNEVLSKPLGKDELENARRRAQEAMMMYHEMVTGDKESDVLETSECERFTQDLQQTSSKIPEEDLQVTQCIDNNQEDDVEVLRTSSCSERRTYTSSIEIFIKGDSNDNEKKEKSQRMDSSYYSNDEDEEDKEETQPKLLPRLQTRPPLKPKPFPCLPKKERELVYENFTLQPLGENVYENVFVRPPPDLIDTVYDVPRIHAKRSMSLPEVVPLRTRCDSGDDSMLAEKSSYPKYENVILYLNDVSEEEKQRSSKDVKEHIVDELVDTERKYQEKLKFVIENYVYYLRNQKQHTTEHKHIFLNIENIYLETEDFLRSLEVCGYNYCEIGKAFFKHKNLFDRYPVYCKNKLKAVLLINEVYKDVLLAREEELGDRLGLNSHLLVPIQRITKYELLLQKLCDHLAKEGDVIALAGVQKALVFVKRIAHRGNDLIIIDSIEGNPHSITETGDFVMMDAFRMTSPKKMDVCLFLFKKMLIFASRVGKKKDEYKYYTYIPVDSLSKKNGKGLLLTVEDFNMKKRHSEPPYLLEAKDLELKLRWTSKLEEMLWSQFSQQRDETRKRYNFEPFEPSKEIPLVVLQSESSIQQEVTPKRKRSIFKKQ